MINGRLGFWTSGAEAAEDAGPRRAPRLERDLDVDVAVVGGGYTGLWTAIEIAERSPATSVAIVEAEQFGYGASARNGGWLSGKPVGVREVLAKRLGRQAVIETEHRLREAMEWIPARLSEAGHDIRAHHGGSLLIARSEAELTRCRDSVDTARSWGLGPDRARLIDADELRNHINVEGAVGAVLSPDMVRIDPLRLLTGLCAIADAAGVQRFVGARVLDINGSVATTASHVVRARKIVVATEGYTSAFPQRRRAMLPLNSSMIATRKLTDAEWNRIGWQGREGISGASHTYFYGQRTPDDRIIIGGRGKPYRFRSGVDRFGEVDGRTVSALHELASSLFPDVDVQPEFAWCGVLGVTRDWSPCIEATNDGSLIVAGGYAGQGVTAARLAGAAIAALVTGKGHEHEELPWVRPWPRAWEPEPLRWIGANGLYRAYAIADRIEARTGRTSVVAKAANLLAGR